MGLFEWLTTLFNLPHPEEKRVFELDDGLYQSLEHLAAREQCRPEDMVASILEDAIQKREKMVFSQQIWDTLSPREQQVAAFVCLNYTNREIAARLLISPETVKCHVRNLLIKFGLHSKQELSQFLDDWDFSGWERG
jgi:DNA-binding NarL/FixJ family response regulator